MPGGNLPFEPDAPSGLLGEIAGMEEEGEEIDEEPIIYEDVKTIIVPRGFTGIIDLGSEEGESVVSEDSMHVVLDSAIGMDTPEGYLKFEQVVIAKEMVQDYNGTSVYKPADELRKILDHGEYRFMTDEHPPNGVVTSVDEIRGYNENLTFTDNNELATDIIITCKKLGDEIRSGKKREVSIGFRADTKSEAGIFGDAPYTEVQTNFLLDHIAMTELGRCSRIDGCGLPKGDSAKIKETAPQILSDSNKDKLAKADAILANHRIDLIAQISAGTNKIERDQLDKMGLEELQRTATIVKQNNSTTPGYVPNGKSIKNDIDDAYAKIGSD